jgi:phytanoyl-CoA hydroxylase
MKHATGSGTTVPAAPDVELHSWNRDFTWEDHKGPFRRVTDEQAARFDELGFFVIDDVLTPEELARTVAEIDRFEEATEAALLERGGRESISEAGAITFTTHLVTRSPWLRSIATSAVLTDLCADLIGPDVRLYWDQAVYKKPERTRRFPWHQDNGYVYVEPQAYLTCWIALTDATRENGCPQVAPGLHRRGTLRHRWVDPLGFQCLDDAPDAMVAEVAAGGAVVFSSLTPHRTGPNLTDEVRKAYILQFAPDGAAVLRGAASKPPAERIACDDPGRQLVVLRQGSPVPAPPIPEATP